MLQPLRIGTAGWNIPSRNKERILAQGSHLERYSHYLNAVEINSSFYRSHQSKTYERWKRSTPASFRFSVKMPKAITHERKLADCDSLLDSFVAEIAGLGEKLGVLLVQTPPSLRFDGKIADEFFRSLKARIECPIAVEPRHISWFEPEMDSWFTQRQIALVAADPALFAGSGDPGGWENIAYFRWHGLERVYYSDYDQAALAALEGRLEACRLRGASVWCIFDNTASGAAFGNALSLAASSSR